jgi:2-(1,2-epoxy-1,2-dihydrophenyl)acetyl-CoA isomerase
MDFERIEWALEDGVARVTLAQPAKLNVLSRALLAELRQAFDQVEAAGARALVIDARGKAFSSGGDLADPMTRDGELGVLLEEHYHPALLRLLALPCLTLCAVDGLCVGGACGLTAACDMTFATERARFSFPFAEIGLVPDCSLAWLLPRIVGRAQARRLLLLGETIDGAEALRIGLVSRLVAPVELPATLAETLDRIRALDPAALAGAKRLLREAEDGGLQETLSLERRLQQAAGRSARFGATLERLAR